MEKKLNATEARAITDSSDIILARIYKLIKDAAKEGATRFVYDIPYGSPAGVQIIEKDLVQQGYQVKVDRVDEDEEFYTYFIKISW